MPTLVNLTPHGIRVALPATDESPGEGFGPEDGIEEIPPSGIVARCATPTPAQPEYHGPYAVVRRGPLGPVEGLPDPRPGTFYIVSLPVLTHPSVSHRRDIIAPDTSPSGAVRGPDGLVRFVDRFVGNL